MAVERLRQQPPEPVADLQVALEATRDPVAGFPLWLAITIRNAAPDVVESGLPSICRLGSIDVDITLRGETTTIEWSTHAMEHHGYALEPGEARMFFVDLADLFPVLEPGEYALAVVVPGRDAVGVLPLRVLPPTESERELAACLRRRDGWLASLVLDPHAPTIAWCSLSPRTRSSVAMYTVLRRATWAPALGDVPLALLRGFTGVLEPEAAALAYELARAARDPSVAAIREEISMRWPTLAWRVAEIDEGHGLLATLRGLRAD